MDRTVASDLSARLAALRVRSGRASCRELASDLEEQLRGRIDGIADVVVHTEP